MKKLEVLISACEEEIRQGRPFEAARRLRKLNLSRVPQPWRLPLARLCRRVALYNQGLTLLGKRIHGDGKILKDPPTPAELAEYGAILLRSGAVSEAQNYLQRADASLAPDALLYRAFAHFMKWEFAESVPLLERFNGSDIPEYTRLVGQTNLGYALIESGEYARGRELLSIVIEQARSSGHSTLEKNSLCYRAFSHFQEGNFAKAQSDLESAKSSISGQPTNDQLVILKYQLLFDGVRNRDLKPINDLRELAMKARDSASHREADLHALKIQFNLERFLYLYFGTPFQAFRERLCRELNFTPDRDTYVLGKKSAPRFDLSTGMIDGRLAINPGHKCHQLIDVLLADFYQPMRINAIFASMFPGEYFMDGFSHDRVHQVIRRTRAWFKELKLPASIKEQSEFYRLELDGDLSFRIPLERVKIDPMHLQFRALQEKFRHRPLFSAREVREALGIPKTSAFRLLSWAIESKYLERMGSDPKQSVYRWCALSQIKPAA